MPAGLRLEVSGVSVPGIGLKVGSSSRYGGPKDGAKMDGILDLGNFWDKATV